MSSDGSGFVSECVWSARKGEQWEDQGELVLVVRCSWPRRDLESFCVGLGASVNLEDSGFIFCGYGVRMIGIMALLMLACSDQMGHAKKAARCTWEVWRYGLVLGEGVDLG